MTLVEIEEFEDLEDSSEGSESSVEEDQEEKSFMSSLPNYLNNLTLSLNINNRINALETSIWKLCEHSVAAKRPSLRSITKLWNQLADEESEALKKRLAFEEVQKKTNAEVQKTLGPKIKYGGEEVKKVTVKKEDGGLSKEFWTQFLGLEEMAEDSGGGGRMVQPPVNLFYHRFYQSTYDKVKMCLMTPVALVRACIVLLLLVIALVFVYIGTFGLDEDTKANRVPFSWWRRTLRWITAHFILRSVFFIGGFHWVRRIGKQASPNEAQVIVAAPHSSYLDAFPIALTGGPSVVAKSESKALPFFGPLIDFTQPIYVNREDPSSRTRCAQEIRRRVQSEDEWPQVLIFPEGTCTNRSGLAQFKVGAFLAGVPVQPFVIRYPNRLDCFSWTFDGPGAAWSAFVALTQFHNFIEVEFLPVYTPNEAEKADPILYAGNVQQVMAEALAIPATQFTLQDALVLYQLSQSKIRRKLKSIWKLKGDLNLREAPTETTLVYDGTARVNYEWKSNLVQFQEIFNVQEDGAAHPQVAELYRMFLLETQTEIDLRGYLVLVCFMYSDAGLDLLTTLLFKMYAGKKREISLQEFKNLLQNVFESSEEESTKLFHSGSTDNNRISISFEEFSRKIERRMEFVKLYAMEETGQRSGNFPRRSDRDHCNKLKLE